MSTYHKRSRRRRTNNQPVDLIETSNNVSKGFAFQFLPDTFDSHSFSPINDTNPSMRDMSFVADNIAEAEGWTQYRSYDSLKSQLNPDMCLKSEQGRFIQEPFNRTIHSADVMPQFSTRSGYGSNDIYNVNAINRKNQLFTGNIPSVSNKQEAESLFTPQINRSMEVGLQAKGARERVNVGNCHDGVDMTVKTRDAPLDYTYRTKEKTIDDLRVNPKKNIEGRYVTSGMRGLGNRSMFPTTIATKKCEQFKTTTEDDLYADRGDRYAPKAKDNFVMKIPYKDSQHVEHSGGAYRADHTMERNVPKEMQAIQAESRRQNFLMPEPMQKHSREQAMYNQNIEAYRVGTTLKDQTIDNKRAGQLGGITKSYAKQPNKLAVTNKETMIEGYAHHQVTPHVMKGLVHNHRVGTTGKELVEDNVRGPTIDAMKALGTIAKSNKPLDTTLKETVLETIQPANIHRDGMYAKPNLVVDTTMKELIDIDWSEYAQFDAGLDAGTVRGNINVATTLKEQYDDIGQHHIIDNHVKASVARNKQPVATTAKELTSRESRKNVSDVYNKGIVRGNYKVATTLKEQTDAVPTNKFISAINQKVRARNKAPLAVTKKEQTINGYDPRNITGKGLYVKNKAPLAATLKEGLIDATRVGGLGNGNMKTTARNKAQLDTTLKELVQEQDWTGPLLSEHKKAMVQDPARNHQFNSIREQLQKYREPTQEGVKVTAGVNSINAAFRDDDKPINREALGGYAYNPNLPRPTSCFTAKKEEDISFDRSINSNVLKQMEDNPYAINYDVNVFA